MIDKLCDYVIKKIKEKVEDINDEKEVVIDFGVRLLIGEVPKIILLIIIGFLLGFGWYTVIMFLLLAPYRSNTGGFHLKTHLGCMLTTIVLYLVPIIIAKTITITNQTIFYSMIGFVTIMSIILIAKYVPADTENIPILAKKDRKMKKIKAYICLAILIAIILFIPNYIVRYMLLYGMFLQNLTLTPIAYKLTNNKYGYEVYS